MTHLLYHMAEAGLLKCVDLHYGDLGGRCDEEGCDTHKAEAYTLAGVDTLVVVGLVGFVALKSHLQSSCLFSPCLKITGSCYPDIVYPFFPSDLQGASSLPTLLWQFLPAEHQRVAFSSVLLAYSCLKCCKVTFSSH